MSESVPSLCEVGRSLLEKTENLKRTLLENKTMEGNTKATDQSFLQSVYNSESVQKVVNQVQETAKDVMSKSLAENVENLKNNIAENYDNVKEKVQNATNAAAEIKDNFMNKTISENVETLKNNAKESLENLKSSVEHATEMKNKVLDNVKNSVPEKKTIEEVTSNLQKQMTPVFQRFLEGPKRDSPPVDKSIISVLYLIRDLIWVWLLSFPIFFKTLVGKFTTKNEKDLKDKVVVVTGAASGFGKEMSFQLAKLGCKVACVDFSDEANKETVLSIMYATGKKDVAKAYHCDVSKPEETKKLAEDVLKDFGRVDILVSNAGILYGHYVADGSDEMLKKVLDINLAGNFWMVRAFLPIMKKNKSGHLVFMSSASGVLPLGKAPSYSASKWGVLGLAYSLDDELRQNPEYNDIKVTTILPYFVVTNPLYAERWILRIPPLEVSDAVSQMITGIRREYFVMQIPGFELGYMMANIIRMLPMELYRMLRNVLYVDIVLDDNKATPSIEEMVKIRQEQLEKNRKASLNSN